MTAHAIEVERPDRWDYPLSASMLKEDVAWLLQQAPFSLMDQDRFARNTSLADVLRNDARLLHLQPGDIIFREGQYGGTAYLVLTGNARIFLTKLLTQAEADTDQRSRKSWLKLLADTLPGSRRNRPTQGYTDSRRRARPDQAGRGG
ncbi:MAG: hypothetical protein ABI557_18750 [Aureliella sp.]